MTNNLYSSFLLNRTPPYYDETLASWVWRLTHLNYFETPLPLLKMLNMTRHPSTPAFRVAGLNTLRDQAVLNKLAQLTNTSLQEVYSHTVHPVAVHFTLPQHKAQDESFVSDSALPLASRRFSHEIYTTRLNWCPFCLAEARYVRWKWHLPMFFICDIHHCWLLATCSSCKGWVREADMIMGQCRKCGTSLTQAPTIAFDNDEPIIRLQTTLSYWLEGLPDALQLGLPPLEVGALVYVLLGLRYAAQRAGNGWHFYHIPKGVPQPDLDILKQRALMPLERGCLYPTAFRGLMDWPQGFFAFLDAYRQRPQHTRETGLRREFGSLHSAWFARFWKHAAFDTIQAAYNEYLITYIPACHIVKTKRAQEYPEMLKHLDYLNFKQAARYLGTSSRTLLRLVEEHYLTVHHFKPEDSGWLLRTELDPMRQQWENQLSIPELSDILGIYFQIIHDLVEEGFLHMVPAHEATKTSYPHIYRDSMQDMLQSLKMHTTIRTRSQQEGVLLNHVCMNSATARVGLAELLKGICAGRLPAYHPHATLLPLSELWVRRKDAKDFVQALLDERGWITLTQTQHCLNVDRSIVAHFVEANLIHPAHSFGFKQFYHRDEVLALRDRAIKTPEAAILLDIPVKAVYQLIGRGVFSPISGPGVNQHKRYVLDRYALLEWHKEHVLRVELERSADPAQLQDLFATHRIEPLYLSPSVYLRKEVVDVLASAGLTTLLD